METVFGVSMDAIMVVVLTLAIIVLLVVAFLAWRNPIILRLALRNIPRRRAQTVLIVFGLMLATLLVTAAFGTGDTMTYSMRQAFTASLGGIDLRIQKVNPQIAREGPPDFNRPVPTFDQKLLDKLNGKIGDDIQVVVARKPYDFKVREIVQQNSPSTQFPTVFLSLSRLQAMFNIPGQVTHLNVSLKGGALEGTKYSKEVADKLR